MLIGIVKKNAIMMIDFAINAQREHGKTPAEAIHEGCLLRFRPIMMTTMSALMATLPIALGLGAGNGLGMSGQPTIHSKAYLKANIEGGEKFNWFYNDSNNLGLGLDPERHRSARVGARRRSADAIAQPVLSEPAIAGEQATALVVEQQPPGDL